jgi:hypothetical protein
MTRVKETVSNDKGSNHIAAREMYRRLMTVAELLKKSTHDHTGTLETVQLEREKTQESKAVVS